MLAVRCVEQHVEHGRPCETSHNQHPQSSRRFIGLRLEGMHTTTIALIRHGETPWNAEFRIQGRTDIALNERGLEQAVAVAQALQDREWHHVLTSPLQRAATTAELIARELQLTDPEHRHDLIERDFGAAEGLPGGPELDAVRTSPGEFLGAETEYEVGLRGLEALELLHQSYAGRNLIAVSHGSYIRCTLNTVFEFSAPRIRNTGVTLLRRHNEGWSMDLLNDEPIALHVPHRAFPTQPKV